jgi:glycolate oxidase FAD binding subunit
MDRPRNEEELRAILREGRPVHAFGSGTKLHLGPGPAPGTRPVCLRALDRIVAYEPGDLVVTVQAGALLSDVQAALAREGQWLPIDPPFAAATIGGILATNSSGPRRLAYGTARDLLLGLRVAGPDGRATRSGGRVVKNVTGYDLHKLHIGAFGTLGVLLEASFKLRPLPERRAVFVRPCPSIRQAHEILLAVFASKLRPAALEALDGRLLPLTDAPAAALVGVEGSAPIVERHERDLRAIAGGFERREGAAADEVWTRLRDLPERLKDRVRVRIGARPYDLPELLPEGPPLWIRAGNGLAWAHLEPGPEAATAARGWHRRAAAREGYAAVESAPPDLVGRESLPWGFPDDPIMKAIRASRDPARVLNPGRVPL